MIDKVLGFEQPRGRKRPDNASETYINIHVVLPEKMKLLGNLLNHPGQLNQDLFRKKPLKKNPSKIHQVRPSKLLQVPSHEKRLGEKLLKAKKKFRHQQ